MRVPKRWWGWSLAVIAMAALLVWAFRPTAVVVDAGPVVEGALTVTVDEEGMTRVRDRYVIAAPVAGRLGRVLPREGDSIARGQPVAWIDPAPLDPRERRAAEARLAAALDGERRAQAAAAQARSAFAQAEREHQRLETLHTQNVISAEARERAALTAETARRTLEAAEYQAAAAAHETDQARAVLAAAGRVPLSAPAAGRLLRVYEPSERVVAAGTPVAEVGDPSRLEVVADLLSTDAVRVTTGDTMRITGWGDADTLCAVVTRIEPSGFTKVSALGVEEQRVNVVGALLGRPAALGDRFRVDVQVVIWRERRTLLAPRAALFRSGGEWRVFRIEGGRARERPVRVGRQSLDRAQVLEGLVAGDALVLRPDDRVRDGTRLSIRASAAAP